MSGFTAHITVAATAELLCCSREHVLTLIDRGELEAADIGTRGPREGPPKKRMLRISAESLRRFLESRTAEPPTPPPRRFMPATNRKQWY